MIKLNLTGRLVQAACGHPGQVVIGTYVECLAPNCDGLPGRPKCNRCGSGKIEPFSAAHMPPDAVHCVDCGSVWWMGVETD